VIFWVVYLLTRCSARLLDAADPVGLDYPISPGQCCGLGSSLSDLFGFYMVVRCLLGSLMVLARWEASKDAEFLVLRHLWGSIIRFSGRCLGFRGVVWLSGGDPVLAGQAT
jgi:hypothetical protein